MARAPQSRRPDGDQLPPHDLMAEQAVLGCILWSEERAPECLAAARQKFGVAQPFYDLRHDVIFTALCHLADEGMPLGLIPLQARLSQANNLEAVGGLPYLAQLPDVVPTPENLPAYLDIVWDRYLARTGSNSLRRLADQILTAGATPEMIEEAQRQIDALRTARTSTEGQVTPTHIKTVDDFAPEVYDAFFGQAADPAVAGWELPFGFPLRIRMGEMTFMLGEKGMGKSTLWSWINLWLMEQGAKSFVASMEVKKRDTIKKKICQLLGQNRLPDLPEGHATWKRAMAWLLPRVVIFDFLGIVPWRDLLESMKRARQELGCNVFIVDSVMRIGVHAEDIAEADECAKHLADFATSNDCHVLLVNHLNKSDGDVKKRSRGSFAWIDNSHNVVAVERNEEKGKKVGEILANWKAGVFDGREKDRRIAEIADQWDGKFKLYNQRLDGTQQNGSCVLWFDFYSGQYRDDFQAPSGVNLLDRWTKNQAVKANAPVGRRIIQ